MSNNFLIFIALFGCEYYAQASTDFNISAKYSTTTGFAPLVQPYAKYTVSIADWRKFDPNSIREFGQGHFCGGSIIGSKTILTAAHCLHSYSPDDVVVIAGTPKLTKKVGSTQILRVKSIRIHPQYVNAQKPPYDIAIIHLRDVINEDAKTAAKIKLTQTSVKTGENCVLVGWGKFTNTIPREDNLHYTKFVVKKKRKCDRELGPSLLNAFCAGDPNGNDRSGCVGAGLGGPLICNARLSGIVSTIPRCDKPKPTLFTDVAKYLDWIQANSPDEIKFKSAARQNLCNNLMKTSIVTLFVVKSMALIII